MKNFVFSLIAISVALLSADTVFAGGSGGGKGVGRVRVVNNTQKHITVALLTEAEAAHLQANPNSSATSIKRANVEPGKSYTFQNGRTKPGNYVLFAFQTADPSIPANPTVGDIASLGSFRQSFIQVSRLSRQRVTISGLVAASANDAAPTIGAPVPE